MVHCGLPHLDGLLGYAEAVSWPNSFQRLSCKGPPICHRLGIPKCSDHYQWRDVKTVVYCSSVHQLWNPLDLHTVYKIKSKLIIGLHCIITLIKKSLSNNNISVSGVDYSIQSWQYPSFKYVLYYDLFLIFYLPQYVSLEEFTLGNIHSVPSYSQLQLISIRISSPWDTVFTCYHKYTEQKWHIKRYNKMSTKVCFKLKTVFSETLFDISSKFLVLDYPAKHIWCDLSTNFEQITHP